MTEPDVKLLETALPSAKRFSQSFTGESLDFPVHILLHCLSDNLSKTLVEEDPKGGEGGGGNQTNTEKDHLVAANKEILSLNNELKMLNQIRQLQLRSHLREGKLLPVWVFAVSDRVPSCRNEQAPYPSIREQVAPYAISGLGQEPLRALIGSDGLVARGRVLRRK